MKHFDNILHNNAVTSRVNKLKFLTNKKHLTTTATKKKQRFSSGVEIIQSTDKRFELATFQIPKKKPLSQLHHNSAFFIYIKRAIIN